jgi:hypothetical protein
MKLFVGIDVSSQRLDVCFLDSDDHVLYQGLLLNDINGASKIRELILEFADTIHYDVIKVEIESTSVYSFHPATFLAEDVDLKGLGIEVIIKTLKLLPALKASLKKTRQTELMSSSLLKQVKYLSPVNPLS